MAGFESTTVEITIGYLTSLHSSYGLYLQQ